MHPKKKHGEIFESSASESFSTMHVVGSMQASSSDQMMARIMLHRVLDLVPQASFTGQRHGRSASESSLLLRP